MEANFEPQQPKRDPMKFIYYTLYAGIIGFVFAILVLFFPHLIFTQQSPFFEYTISNKREILNKQLSERIIVLKQEVDSLQKKAASSKNTLPEQEEEIETNIKKKKAQLEQYILDQNGLMLANTDTSLTYYAPYFSIDRTVLFDSLNNEKLGSVKFKFLLQELMKTTENYGNKAKSDVGLSKVPARNTVSFVRKYPSFGLWLIISIAQMSLWFIVAAILFMTATNTLNNLTVFPEVSIFKFKKQMAAVAIILGIFLFSIYAVLIDEMVVHDHFFLEFFNRRLNIFAIIGYLVAAFCLYVYLVFASKAVELNEAASSVSSPESIASDLLKIKENIDYSFGLCALLLSVFVISVGLLFNAVNSLDIMVYYKQISGKPYLINDYVTLTGILNSMILILFYVPVKLSFNSLQIVKSASQGDDSSKPWYNQISESFMKELSPVLLTVSPLLTSFVQRLTSDFLNS